LPHFEDEKAYVFDINLSVKLIEDDGTETSLAKTNAKELYYSPVPDIASFLFRFRYVGW
jgi:hypothetical protein